jgi:hypothetical protein
VLSSLAALFIIRFSDGDRRATIIGTAFVAHIRAGIRIRIRGRIAARKQAVERRSEKVAYRSKHNPPLIALHFSIARILDSITSCRGHARAVYCKAWASCFWQPSLQIENQAKLPLPLDMFATPYGSRHAATDILGSICSLDLLRVYKRICRRSRYRLMINRSCLKGGIPRLLVLNTVG